MSDLTFIYALCDPTTLEIRYIGKSNDPKQRLRGHLSDKRSSHKTCWIKSLRASGLKPVLQVLCCVGDDVWPAIEKYWIRLVGMDNLVNSAEGGKGSPCFKHTSEARKKISAAGKGRKKSNEEKEKIRQAMLGKRHGAGHKYTPTLKTRKKMSESHIGHNPSKETREKLSIAAKNQWKRVKEAANA